MQLDLADDWMQWDSLEPITLVSTRINGDAPDTVLQTKRRAITYREVAASGGAYVGGDVVFLFPAPLVLNGPPKPGDVLLDLEENRFTVLQEVGQRRDRAGYQTHRVVTRNLAIAFDLRSLDVSIETPRLTNDEAGVELRTWATLYAAGSFRCKVQKIEDAVADERAIRGMKGAYKVYLDRELVVTNKDRVTWPAAPAKYLEIVKYTPAAGLGDLPVIDCEAVP